MATVKLVSDKMIGGLKNLSKKENVDPKNIAILIHTKETETDKEGNETLTYNPLYFYAVDGVPKKDENGRLINLTFKQAMGIRNDYMRLGFMVGHFLSNYFKTLEQVEEIPAQEIYLRITTHDEGQEIENLALGLYRNSELIKKLTLQEVLGDE